MDSLTLTIILSLFNLYINITSQSSLKLLFCYYLFFLFVVYTINLPVVRPQSCRVIYYFDTPTLGRRHQLFGRVATRSFVANRIVGKLGENVRMVEKGFIISTPLSEILNINFILKGVKINKKGCEMRINLIPLELQDFDMAIGYK